MANVAVLAATVTWASTTFQGLDAVNNLSKDNKTKSVVDKMCLFFDKVGGYLAEIHGNMEATIDLLKKIPTVEVSGLSGDNRAEIMQLYRYIREYLEGREHEIRTSKNRWLPGKAQNEMKKQLKEHRNMSRSMRVLALEASKHAEEYEQNQIAIKDKAKALLTQDDNGPLSSLPADKQRLAQSIANFRECYVRHHQNNYPPNEATHLTAKELFDLFLESLKKVRAEANTDVPKGQVDVVVLEVVRYILEATGPNYLFWDISTDNSQSSSSSFTDSRNPFDDPNRPIIRADSDPTAELAPEPVNSPPPELAATSAKRHSF